MSNDTATSASGKAPSSIISRRTTGALDGVVVALGYLIVQSRFLFTPWIYDSIEYFVIASRLEKAAPFHRSLRIGLLGPIRLAQEVFSYSEIAYYLVPVLSGLGLALGTYFLARLLFNRSVGLLSAAIVIVNPLILASSSQIFPDIPSAATFTGAMVAVVAAGTRYQRDRIVDRRLLGLMALAGFLLGWSYLIREFVVILFPVVAVTMLIYRLPSRAWFALGGTALAMFGVELAWGWLRYGDAFVRIGDLADKAEPTELLQQRIRQRAAATDSALSKLTTLPRVIGLDLPGLVFTALGLFGIAAAVITRDARLLILAVWSVVYWALLMGAYIYVDDFGRPLIRATLVRYWFPLLPAFVIGGIGAISVLASRVSSRLSLLLVAGLGGAVLAMGGLSTLPLHKSGDFPTEFHSFRDWIAQEGHAYGDIWTDQRTSWLLPLYTKTPFGQPVWEGKISRINTARRFEPVDFVKEGLIVYHDDFFRAPLSGWRGSVPHGYFDPPADWAPEFTSSDSDVVVYVNPGLEDGRKLFDVDGIQSTWVPPKNHPSLAATVGEWPVEIEVDGEPVRMTVGPADIQNAPTQIGVVPSSGSVRVTLELQVKDAWIVFECGYWSKDGFQLKHGTTLYYPTEDPTSVEFVCAVPEATSEPITVRPWLTLSGEGHVVLGQAVVDWFPTDP